MTEPDEQPDDTMRVLGGRPRTRAEWAGTSSHRPQPAQQTRPSGRTTSTRTR